MRQKILFLFTLLVLLFSLISANKRPLHIFMAGDSTMADKPFYKSITDSLTGEMIQEPFPERGWGQLLPSFFDKNIVIQNYAKNGRSSRTFIEEGLWQKITDNVKTGDYVIIQFGHNDSSKEKVDRYTSPEDYEKNLTQFVVEIKEKGGNPILCTSVARRYFNKEGSFRDSHGEYLDLVRKVAQEQNIPMVDLYEKSKKVIVEMGEEASKELFMHLPKGANRHFPEGKIDNTHFVEKGAKEIARLFVEGLQEQKIEDLLDKLN